MFTALWREIRQIRVYTVVLVCAATLFVYFDALRVLAEPLLPGLQHTAMLALAVLCLVLLYADGAAPDDRVPGGPWRLSDRRRRRDAVIAALAILVLLALCAEMLGWLRPFQPASHTEISEDGFSTLTYPEIENAGGAFAFLGNIVFSFAAGAVVLLGLCAPACAAIYGLRRAPLESWRSLRRRLFAVFGVSALAIFALAPAGVLLRPVQAFWDSVGDPQNLQRAIDICNRVGPQNIAPFAAAGTILLAIVVWIYSRAVARIIEQPRG